MMIFKAEKKVGIVLLVVTLFLLAACFYQQSNSSSIKQQTQLSAVELTTYDSDNKLYKQKMKLKPERIIAIWQTSIETLIALGQEDKIIAAVGLPDDKCLKEEYRAAYNKIPYKNFNTLNQEAALAMRPDFILTSWASSFSAKNIGRTEFWNERNVGTYISEVPPAVGGRRTIEHEYKYIRDMGRLFDAEAKADVIISEIEGEIAHVINKLPANSEERKQVLVIQFMGSKLKNWGSDYLQGDIVNKLHGALAIEESKFIGYEDLLAADPEVIFLMANEWEYANLQGVSDKLLADRKFSSLRAVKNKRVYVIPLYLGQYSAVRLGEGIRAFAKGMYPKFY